MDYGTDFDASHLGETGREQLHSYLVESLVDGKSTLLYKKPALTHLPLYESTALRRGSLASAAPVYNMPSRR